MQRKLAIKLFLAEIGVSYVLPVRHKNTSPPSRLLTPAAIGCLLPTFVCNWTPREINRANISWKSQRLTVWFLPPDRIRTNQLYLTEDIGHRIPLGKHCACISSRVSPNSLKMTAHHRYIKIRSRAWRRRISLIEILTVLINLPFCRCASLASSFAYFTTSDVWHVHSCRTWRSGNLTSPFDWCVVWTSAFRRFMTPRFTDKIANWIVQIHWRFLCIPCQFGKTLNSKENQIK